MAPDRLILFVYWNIYTSKGAAVATSFTWVLSMACRPGDRSVELEVFHAFLRSVTFPHPHTSSVRASLLVWAKEKESTLPTCLVCHVFCDSIRRLLLATSLVEASPIWSTILIDSDALAAAYCSCNVNMEKLELCSCNYYACMQAN
jgi:hypothetical protein